MKKHNWWVGVWTIFSLVLLLPMFSQAQSRSITGKVTDSRDNTPLQGVSVQVKGTNTGTITASASTFTITVPSRDSRLIISYSGLASEDGSVGDKTTVDVQLARRSSLQEVLEVG